MAAPYDPTDPYLDTGEQDPALDTEQLYVRPSPEPAPAAGAAVTPSPLATPAPTGSPTDTEVPPAIGYAPDVYGTSSAPAPLPPGAGELEPSTAAAEPAKPEKPEKSVVGMKTPWGTIGGEAFNASPAEANVPEAPPPGFLAESGKALVRGSVGEARKIGIVATRGADFIARQFDIDSPAIKDALESQLKGWEQFTKDWAPDTNDPVEAWHKYHSVSAVLSQSASAALEIVPTILAGAATGGFATIPRSAALLGTLGGIDANIKSGGDPIATGVGILVGYAVGAGQAGLIMTKPGQEMFGGWLKSTVDAVAGKPLAGAAAAAPTLAAPGLLGKAVGLEALGAAQTELGPVIDMAGGKPYEQPTAGQRVASLFNNTGLVAIVGLTGGGVRPAPAPRTTPPATTPGVPAAEAAAIRLALPPPRPGLPPPRETPLGGLPPEPGGAPPGAPPEAPPGAPGAAPEGEPGGIAARVKDVTRDTVEGTLGAAPPAGEGGAEGAPGEGVAPEVAAALAPTARFAPQQRTELARRGYSEERIQELERSMAQPPEGGAATGPLQEQPTTPTLTPARAEPLAPEPPASQPAPTTEPTAPRPAPTAEPTVPARPTVERAAPSPEIRTEPDDVNKGQVVAKNTGGDVIGKGSTPEAAVADARARGGEVYPEEPPPTAGTTAPSEIPPEIPSDIKRPAASEIAKPLAARAEPAPDITEKSAPITPTTSSEVAPPKTVGEALAQAKAEGAGEKPSFTVEKVKRRAASEQAKPLEPKAEPENQLKPTQPTQPKTTLTLQKRGAVEQAVAARAEQLRAAQERPVSTEPVAEQVTQQPLRRGAAREGVAGGRTLGDELNIPREQQGQAMRLASTTTNKTTIGKALVQDILDNHHTVEEAANLYGRRTGGRGRPSTAGNNFAEFMGRHIEAVNEAGDKGATQAARLRDQYTAEQARLKSEGKTSSDKLTRIEGKITELAGEMKQVNSLDRLHEIQAQAKAHIDSTIAPKVEPRARAREQAKEVKLPTDEESMARFQALRDNPDISEDRQARSPEATDARTKVASDLADRALSRPIRERLNASNKAGRTVSLHKVLQEDVIDNKPAQALAPHLVELSKQIQRLLGSADVPVGSYRLMQNLAHTEGLRNAWQESIDRGAAGGYESIHDIIGINEKAPRPVETVVHEAVHATTRRYFQNLFEKKSYGEPLEPEEQRHFDAIRAMQKELLKIKDSDTTLTDNDKFLLDYAVSGQGHEIPTLVMTKPQVQAILARKEPSSAFRQEMARLGYDTPQPSLWHSFVEIMRQVFHLGRDGKSTLESMLRPLTDITEAGGALDREAREFFGTNRYFNRRTASIDKPALFEDRAAPDMSHDIPTDALPDEPTREAARPMGEAMRTGFMGSPAAVERGVGKAVQYIADRKGSVSSAVRRTVSPFRSTKDLVEANKDVTPSIEKVHEAQKNAHHETEEFMRRWGDKVQDMGHRIQQASDDFRQLIVDVGVLPTKRGATYGVAARLGGKDFLADNAHLNSEQLKVAENLQKTYDNLPAPERALYKELQDMHRAMDVEEKQAVFKSIADRAFADWTPAERGILETMFKSRRTLENFINNPDASPIADAVGERWQNSRLFAQELAKEWRTGWIEGDYFPQRRYGDYIVSYGDKEHPETYGVEMFERRGEGMARARQLEDEGVNDVHAVARKEAFNARNVLPEGTIENLDKALQSRTKLSPQEVQDLKDSGVSDKAINQMQRYRLDTDQIKAVRDEMVGLRLRNATSSQQARTRARRQGIKGATTDAAKVLYMDTLGSASRVGHLLHGGEETAALAAMRREVTSLRNQGLTRQAEYERGNDALHEMTQRATPIDGDRSMSLAAKLGRGVSRLAFVMQLMRVAHPILQAVETNIRAMAYLGARFGYGRTAVMLTKALLDVAPTAWRQGLHNMATIMHSDMKTSNWDMRGVMLKRLQASMGDPAHAQALVDMMDREGAFTHSITLEMRRLAQPGGFDTTGSGAGGIARRLANNAMDLFTVAEHTVDVMNRSAAAKAAFEMAMRDTKGNVAESLDHAREMMGRIAPSVAPWNIPRMATQQGPFKGWTGPIMQYKVTAMQLYSTMAAIAKEMSFKTPEGREAIKAITGLIGMNSALVGGVTGNVFGVGVSGMFGLLDWVEGRDKPRDREPEVRRWLAERFGEPASLFLARGAAGLAGFDVHTNIGLSNMAGIKGPESFDAKGFAQMVGNTVGGPALAAGTQVTIGLHNLINGNYAKAVDQLQPRVTRDIFRAYNERTAGLTDSRGAVIREPGETTVGGTIGTAIGLNPNAYYYDRRNAGIQARSYLQEDRQHAVDAWLRSGDRTAVDQFNADNQHEGERINYSELYKAQKQQRDQLRKPEDYGLKVSPKQRRFMEDAMRF